MAGLADGYVLVVVTGFDSYQNALIQGIQPVLQAHGLPLLGYVNCLPTPEFPSELTCLLSHSTPIAAITTGVHTPGHEQILNDLLAAHRIPAVHIGAEYPGQSWIRADNDQAMTAMMAHALDQLGATRPAMLRGMRHQSDHTDREKVFRREVERRGMVIDEDLMINGGSETDNIHREMRDLMRRRRDMDLLVTTDDWSAITAIQVMTEAGLRVPEDVAVTGFDNFPISAVHWPSLTTVDQNLTEQGAAAAEAVVRHVAGDARPVQRLIPCRVIVRASTARSEADMTEVPSVRTISESAERQLRAQSGLQRLSRALLTCHSMDDVCTALADGLPQLGIQRSFLVVYEGEPLATDADGITHRNCRLVLDYRDGRSHPVPTETFNSCALLPPYLAGEFAAGFLGIQALAVSKGSLGYLVFEPPFKSLLMTETIRIDLARTLEAVFNERELAANFAMLEHLVAVRTSELEIRTSELEAEVATRRRAEKELHDANRELQRSLVTDGLTRIANRTALSRHLDEQWNRHTGPGDEMAILMIDVDMFKAYNDRYGHMRGDRALQTVAACLQRSVRYPDDLACRFGGEEFLVVLPRTGLRAALTVANRFRRLLAAESIAHDASPVAPIVTASIGVAVVAPSVTGTSEMAILAADQAMYQAKSAGRDRIAVADRSDHAARTVSGERA